MCGKNVTEDGWHGLSCLRSAGRFSGHSDLNALIKQSLSFIHFPSVLEPRHLYMTDKKQLDDLTLVPWAVCKQLLWDVTVVDSLAPSRISTVSACNPGTAAAEKRNHAWIGTGLLVNLVRLPLKRKSEKMTGIKI